jgi:hypothetical protein
MGTAAWGVAHIVAPFKGNKAVNEPYTSSPRSDPVQDLISTLLALAPPVGGESSSGSSGDGSLFSLPDTAQLISSVSDIGQAPSNGGNTPPPSGGDSNGNPPPGGGGFDLGGLGGLNRPGGGESTGPNGVVTDVLANVPAVCTGSGASASSESGTDSAEPAESAPAEDDGTENDGTENAGTPPADEASSSPECAPIVPVDAAQPPSTDASSSPVSSGAGTLS